MKEYHFYYYTKNNRLIKGSHSSLQMALRFSNNQTLAKQELTAMGAKPVSAVLTVVK